MLSMGFTLADDVHATVMVKRTGDDGVTPVTVINTSGNAITSPEVIYALGCGTSHASPYCMSIGDKQTAPDSGIRIEEGCAHSFDDYYVCQGAVEDWIKNTAGTNTKSDWLCPRGSSEMCAGR